MRATGRFSPFRSGLSPASPISLSVANSPALPNVVSVLEDRDGDQRRACKGCLYFPSVDSAVAPGNPWLRPEPLTPGFGRVDALPP